jgi:hypothetical protein
VNIDRRQLLIGGTCAAMAGSFGDVGAGRSPLQPIRDTGKWHPLTRSLLKRARKANVGRETPDRFRVERTIRQFGDASGWTKPLVIKWMDSPTDAFDHLGRLGLDALLDMGTASFWRRAQPPVPCDEEAFDRAFEVRMMANELLGVDERDRLLMAAKLLAKSKAKSENASDEEVFRVRAASAQIGWLETSLAEAAAQTISNVELILSTGASEGSVAIDHQLRVFEAHEHGLLATWETPAALICVPRIRVYPPCLTL